MKTQITSTSTRCPARWHLLAAFVITVLISSLPAATLNAAENETQTSSTGNTSQQPINRSISMIPNDPLSSLMLPQAGRNRRISSNQQPEWHDGNFDMTRLAPGEEFTFPVLKGPGYINHIWFTSHAGAVGELNALSMRIYWDGRDEPGVEVPVGDFFACGNQPTEVESYPVQVSETGSLTCYWRMPFRESARIVIRNDNMDRGAGLYWQVDWVELPELPPDTAYFHARYRQEYPAVMDQDYMIADIKGKGTYVGTVMSITMGQDGWFGEGDDFFYIDGEEVPSLQGTGSEDYFNDAWGFRRRISTWFGQPRWTGWSAGDEGICYRWHILDPVRFEKSLRLDMEHKGNRDNPHEAWYIERPDFFSSIAMWYQVEEPEQLFGNLPDWPERNVPWIRQHLVPTLKNAEHTGETSPVVQALGMFGSRPIIFWRNTERDTTLTLPFTVEEDGRYAIRLHAFKARDYGVFDIEIDGKPALQKVDFLGEYGYASATDMLIGTHILKKGEHKLTFRCVSDNPDRRYLGVESLRILKLPPEVFRDVKGENERGFIRTAIGSAIYGYRLLHSTVPDSLETLVELGMMDERFLRDENEYPLKSHREGNTLIVESTGPEGWVHRWSGADARR